MTSPNVVAFQSPAHLEQTFVLPHRGQIIGMGIPKGVTMIAGGGFHVRSPCIQCFSTLTFSNLQGKSTLLDALARGCYNHVPGGTRPNASSRHQC